MKKILIVMAALMSFSAFAQMTSIRVPQHGRGSGSGSGSGSSDIDINLKKMKQEIFASEKYLKKVAEVEQSFNVICDGAQSLSYEKMQILATTICSGKAEIQSYKITILFNLVTE